MRREGDIAMDRDTIYGYNKRGREKGVRKMDPGLFD
jgi:hypothetical protein